MASPLSALSREIDRTELVCALSGKSWRDCTVELDARIAEAPPSGFASFLVFVRFTDPRNALWPECMRERSADGRCEWHAALLQGSSVGWPLTAIAKRRLDALETGKALRLKIEAARNEVSASIDGREVGRGRTTVTSPGPIALAPLKIRARFDNIPVRAVEPERRDR